MKEQNEIMQNAIRLAETWQKHAETLVSELDKNFHRQMNKMLKNKSDKLLLIELMDQAFRSQNTYRVANQIEYIFQKYKMASFFSTAERFLLWLFLNGGKFLPQISVPAFINQIRESTKSVVLKGEPQFLNAHLQKRREKNVRVNINLIGEALLGEAEAEERLQKYLQALSDEHIDYISVKISTIFSQIQSLAFEDTVQELVKRLTILYRQALAYPVPVNTSYADANDVDNAQNPPPQKYVAKFINLDMEEYRDMAITYEAFTRTLSQDEFKNLYAGIVLQAYLPDSHSWQKKLVQWAQARVAAGGSAVRMRLVKGANMEMEEAESALRGWACAPFTRKVDTDANYKRMLNYALQPQHAHAVHLGVASHNLFELAYAYELANANNMLHCFQFEMLEGMSESAHLAIKEISGDVVLYGPTAKKEQFTNAIAYLVRRLDENTGKENFIRYSFGLVVGSPEWEAQKRNFQNAFSNIENLSDEPHRKQNRLQENWQEYKGGSFFTDKFTNEADTDFVLPANREWAKSIVTKWKSIGEKKIIVPVVAGGREIRPQSGERELKDVLDKAQNKICAQVTQANAEDIALAIKTAQKDPDGWRRKTHQERHKILSQVAVEFRKNRADLIGVAAAELGKVFSETDVEVSEAIDFLEFYPHSACYFENMGLSFAGKGVGLVVPPWNFPIAIPAGGVAAALAAGNTVILKPASLAAFCAYEFCKCFWQAGVSQNTLQLLPCSGALAGKELIPHSAIDFVILTGGEDTAHNMLETRPSLFLTAETGGKDATIVTAMSDRDQAVKNVIHSAFSNSGQKCSATSLLVLEKEVYEDENFKRTLVDAAASMYVGSPWDFKSRMSTLSTLPAGALKKGLETLENKESWALAPSYAENNSYLLKPSIKWGVKRGSFCHCTELFGPLLSVMCAANLSEAVEIVNSTGYGLTAGLESLDEREKNYFKENMRAGNLYINRGTTGAIVLRQPFGGMGKSAIGAGRKVGHYNYITQFVNFVPDMLVQEQESRGAELSLLQDFIKKNAEGLYSEFADDFKKLHNALNSYHYWYEHEFSREHDYFSLRGEDNFFRYLSVESIAIRVTQKDSLYAILARIFAARIAGVKNLHVSIDAQANNPTISFLFENKEKLLHSIFNAGSESSMQRQSEEEFIRLFKRVNRIFYADIVNVSESVFQAAARLDKFIVRHSPLAHGRIELLNYLEEQSISHSYHRYGNLGARAFER